MYSPTDMEANVRNGYMIQTKDKTTGFILVFLFGPLGALYFGPAKAAECFGWWIFGVISLVASIFFPLAGLGTLLSGIMMLCFLASILTDPEMTHELTESGKIAKAQYDKEAMARVDESIEKAKQKAGAFLNNLGNKIASATDQAKNAAHTDSTPVVEPIQQEPAATIFQVQAVFCSDCGCKQTATAKFCSSCGSKIEKAA